MSNTTRNVIEIEGELAREITVSVLRTVRTEDLIKQLRYSSEVETPILPVGTIYFYQRGFASMTVIQEYPKIREIKARTPTKERRESFKIYVPNMQWYVCCLAEKNGKQRVVSTYFSASPTPIKPGENSVYHLPLTNYFTDGRGICMGSVNKNLPSLLSVRDFVEDLWNSEWNVEILPHYDDWDFGSWESDDEDGKSYGFGLWESLTNDDMSGLEKRLFKVPALIASSDETTATFDKCIAAVKAKIRKWEAQSE